MTIEPVNQESRLQETIKSKENFALVALISSFALAIIMEIGLISNVCFLYKNIPTKIILCSASHLISSLIAVSGIIYSCKTICDSCKQKEELKRLKFFKKLNKKRSQFKEKRFEDFFPPITAAERERLDEALQELLYTSGIIEENDDIPCRRIFNPFQTISYLKTLIERGSEILNQIPQRLDILTILKYGFEKENQKIKNVLLKNPKIMNILCNNKIFRKCNALRNKIMELCEKGFNNFFHEILPAFAKSIEKDPENIQKAFLIGYNAGDYNGKWLPFLHAIYVE